MFYHKERRIGAFMSNLAVIFPGNKSFYPGMSKELHINFSRARELYKELETIIKRDIIIRLYDDMSDSRLTQEEKNLCVLIAEIINYELFTDIYAITPKYIVTEEIGLLAALVCVKSITLEEAVHIIQAGSSCSNIKYYTEKYSIIEVSNEIHSIGEQDLEWIEKNIYNEAEFDEEACLRRLTEIGVNFLIEIGPNNRLSKKLCNKKSVICCSYIDDESDPNWILENLLYKKFFNTQVIINRLFGIAAATKNNNENYSDYEQEVIQNYTNLKVLSEKENPQNTDIEDAYEYLKKILTYKKVSTEEILYRIRKLKDETLCNTDSFVI